MSKCSINTVFCLFIFFKNDNSNTLLSRLINIIKYGINYQKIIKIPISYGLNKHNFFPTLVSITSILENANKYSYNIIYIMVSNNETLFPKKYKKTFKNLEKKYKMCQICIIEIDNKIFKNAKKGTFPTSTYYRLILANLVPNLNRIIYLDGDTLVLKDLSEMINIKMNNKIIMGFIAYCNYFPMNYRLKNYKYINAGVLLMDLKAIRKENITEQFLHHINRHEFMIDYDQSLINLVLHEGIGLLPPKYGIWTFPNIRDLRAHNYYQINNKTLKHYHTKELNDAYNSPSILHYVRNKPFYLKNFILNTRFEKLWKYYALKVDKLSNIINNFIKY
jgi:lipopolysaccharide biosynthesis glycosyltransferase